MSEIVKIHPINTDSDMVRIAIVPKDGPLQASFQQQADNIESATDTLELITQAQALLGCVNCPLFQPENIITLPNSVLPSYVSDISVRCLAFGNYRRDQMKGLEERGKHTDSESFHTHLELHSEREPVYECFEGFPNCLTEKQLKLALEWVTK